MARSVNKVILIGNLGKDPEIRHFENGGAVANFPIATTESYYDKEKNQSIDLPTDWHNISVRRNGLVKVVENYVKKGQQIYIEGKLRTRTYDKDGVTRYITEVVVDELLLLGSKEGSREDAPKASNSGEPTVHTPKEPLPKHDESDDLPF